MLAASESAFPGWLVFVAVVALGAGLIPLLAALCRRRLPTPRTRSRGFDPLQRLRFGTSPKTRRAPRHAIAAHRTILTSCVLAAMSLMLLTFGPALRTLDLRGLVVAIAFVTPPLLVVFHGRRRRASAPPSNGRTATGQTPRSTG